jgi:hypothetical protein
MLHKKTFQKNPTQIISTVPFAHWRRRYLQFQNIGFSSEKFVTRKTYVCFD